MECFHRRDLSQAWGGRQAPVNRPPSSEGFDRAIFRFWRLPAPRPFDIPCSRRRNCAALAPTSDIDKATQHATHCDLQRANLYTAARARRSMLPPFHPQGCRLTRASSSPADGVEVMGIMVL